MSKEINLVTSSGKKFAFSVPEPADINSFFIFSLPKSGSTLLMNIVADVCKMQKIPSVDLHSRLFQLGIQPPELGDDINCIWQEKGYAYTGFRMFFPQMTFDFSKTKNILLVRDPRDILVSHYFSMKYSHVVPRLKGKDHPVTRQREALQDSNIDRTVLNMAPVYKNYFLNYMKHLSTESTRVYRYEDIIFRKTEWIVDMLDYLNIEIPMRKIKSIADKHDIRPDKEDPKKHIRQVTPGNYKIHLSKTTIEKLDDLFYPVMHYFHYDSVVSFNMGKELQQSGAQSLSRVNAEEEKIQRLKRTIEDMRHSWSWRATAPLRRLVSSFMKKG